MPMHVPLCETGTTIANEQKMPVHREYIQRVVKKAFVCACH
jgi:hypothetical protein